MERYIVIVPRLNVRKAPVTEFTDQNISLPTVSKGVILNLEEYKDVPNPNLGKWYKDSHGQFYWGGGLKLMDTALASDAPLNEYPWWLKNNLYSIPDLWKEKNETKVTIALLDTGINEHIDFNFNNIIGYNYIENTPNYKTDVNGHGTHLAGIMTAQGKISYGVAPNANLFVAKVCDNQGRPVFSAVKEALENILNKKNGAKDIDIINMSFDLAVGKKDVVNIKLKQEIEELIKEIANKKKCLCVAACGNSGEYFDSPLEYSPAYLDEVISVGGFKENFSRDPISNKSVNLDILGPSSGIISLKGKNEVVIDGGTSQSAAFVSAVCALGIQKLKSKDMYSEKLLKNLLYKTAKILPGQVPVEYGHGLINPNYFISLL